MLITLLKVLLILVSLGVLGFGVYQISQKLIPRGVWLIIVSIFGFLSVFIGFGAGKHLAGWFFVFIALCILALGESFVSNVYYAITAPTYSVRHLSKTDPFSFSLLLTLLGGLFVGLYATMFHNAISSAYQAFAKATIESALASYANPTYRDVVFQNGVDRMLDSFSVYYQGNLVWFPLLVVAGWFVFGFLFFVVLRFFGSGASYREILSAISYWCFLFGAIGGYFEFHALLSSLSAPAGSLNVSAVDMLGSLVGLVLWVYLIICLSQGSELPILQTIIAWVIVDVVVGAAIGALVYYLAFPKFNEFIKGLQSFDPSKGMAF